MPRVATGFISFLSLQVFRLGACFESSCGEDDGLFVDPKAILLPALDGRAPVSVLQRRSSIHIYLYKPWRPIVKNEHWLSAIEGCGNSPASSLLLGVPVWLLSHATSER